MSFDSINQRYIYPCRGYGKKAFYYYIDEEIVKDIKFKKAYKETVENRIGNIDYIFKREQIERVKLNGIKQLPGEDCRRSSKMVP